MLYKDVVGTLSKNMWHSHDFKVRSESNQEVLGWRQVSNNCLSQIMIGDRSNSKVLSDGSQISVWAGRKLSVLQRSQDNTVLIYTYILILNYKISYVLCHDQILHKKTLYTYMRQLFQ